MGVMRSDGGLSLILDVINKHPTLAPHQPQSKNNPINNSTKVIKS